jgi:putative chitinase
MAEFDISTPARMAAFLAQILHESGEFRYDGEVWGPTDVQKRYDPPTKLAAKLGNTKTGDGFKYRGAGPLQLTGRSNFRQYGQLLNLDLENNPDLARNPEIGLRIACLYWKRHHLNALADQEDFVGITKAVNGGLTGLNSRLNYYDDALKVLSPLEPNLSGS